MWFERMMKDEGFRKKKARQECPVIAVTAFNNQEVVQQAKKVGMKEIIFKPVDITILAKILKNYYEGFNSPH